MKLAPIAIFAFNRPQSIERCLAALKKNKEWLQSEIYIFCDGPRTEAESVKTQLVRQIVKDFADESPLVRIHEKPDNFGLSKSIITGIKTVFSNHSSIIVIEDDLEVAPNFLAYMNKGLRFYENIGKVSSVVGYSYPLEIDLPDTLFLRGAECWGWATWKDRWEKYFEPDGNIVLKRILDLQINDEVNVLGSYDYIGMLKDQIAGRNNSWAVRWHLNNFAYGQLSLYPGKSLVQNHGFGPDSTHCKGGVSFYFHPIFPPKALDFDFSSDLKENREYTLALADLFRKETAYYLSQSQYPVTTRKKLISFAQKVIKRFLSI